VIPIENAPEIAERIWAQRKLPIVYRPTRGKLLVKLPFREDNRLWLKGEGSRRPKWNPDGKSTNRWRLRGGTKSCVARSCCRLEPLFLAMTMSKRWPRLRHRD
jgi:hypothetical protein